MALALATASYVRTASADSPTITDSYLKTSWRTDRVRIEVSGKGPANTPVEIAGSLTEWPDGSASARTLEPVKTSVGPDGVWSATLETPLKGLKAWSRQQPNLYNYSVEANFTDGFKAARGPRRVGLREVWIENGQFVLNGNPITVVDDVWGHYGIPKNHEGAVLAMRQVKAMGFSGARLSSPEKLLAADETGIVSIASVGSFVKLNIWDPRSGLTRMDGDEKREQVAQKIRDLREHPSIIAWSSNAPYSLTSMHPEYTGQYFNSWKYFPLNRFEGPPEQGQKIFRELVDIAAEIDPTRAVASHNGPYSPIQVSTLYLCDNLDLQEREEFFDFWFRSGPNRKVVWPSEVGMPFAGHQFIRYIDHQMPQGGLWPKIHTENLARLIGEEAYRIEEDANFPNWVSKNFYDLMGWPATQQLSAINFEGIWKAYRTYGVNVSAHHVFREGAYPKLKENPERKGLTSAFPNPEFDPPTVAARAYLDAITPVLGYIGGADTKFTNKDHLYFAGATVHKAYIVINDLDAPVNIDARWQLLDRNGKAMEEGRIKGEVQAGRRALNEFPIQFFAPPVKERSDFTLKVTPVAGAKIPEQSRLTDDFEITVFPQHQTPEIKFSGRIWTVNISDDLTHESPHFLINRDNQQMLRAAGIEPTLVDGMHSFEYIGYSPDAAMVLQGPVAQKGKEPLPGRELSKAGYPKPGDLLILPRHTLAVGHGEREKVLRTLEAMNFDKLVEEGLRVIVFEQALDNILGLQTEDVRPRRAFISAKGHPVFLGLQESDLRYWSGASDLEAAITPYGSGETRWPERLWHTSNTNAVASRTLIRPQLGAVRALAVSGFDLQESPLLEVARGKGRMIFCQFDVSNRYGKDPAATKLVDNLFAYITTVAEPDPSKGKVPIANAETPGVTLRQIFRAAVPEGEAGWGITQGDLFIRESIYNNNQVTRKLPDRKFPAFAANNRAGYPEVVRSDGNGLQTTLTPSLFETGWMKRKAAWVDSALAINQRGSRVEGPSIANHGRITALYPFEWVEKFVHPYTSNIW